MAVTSLGLAVPTSVFFTHYSVTMDSRDTVVNVTALDSMVNTIAPKLCLASLRLAPTPQVSLQQQDSPADTTAVSDYLSICRGTPAPKHAPVILAPVVIALALNMLRLAAPSILGMAFNNAESMISADIQDRPFTRNIDSYSDMNRMSAVQESSSYSIEKGSGVRYTTALRSGAGGAASSAPEPRNVRGDFFWGTLTKVMKEYTINSAADLTYNQVTLHIENGRIATVDTYVPNSINGQCVNACGTGQAIYVLGAAQ
jgi:hypothetical protein